MRNKINLKDWQIEQEKKEINDEIELAFLDARTINDDMQRYNVYFAKMEHGRFNEHDMRDFRYLLKKFNHWETSHKEAYKFVATYGC